MVLKLSRNYYDHAGKKKAGEYVSQCSKSFVVGGKDHNKCTTLMKIIKMVTKLNIVLHGR